MSEQASGGRSMLNPKITTDTLAVRLFCTGTKQLTHPRRALATVSWAPDGRGVMAWHHVQREDWDPHRVPYREVTDDNDTGHDLLDVPCPFPKCPVRFQRRADQLKAVLDEHGDTGRVVSRDIADLR